MSDEGSIVAVIIIAVVGIAYSITRMRQQKDQRAEAQRKAITDPEGFTTTVRTGGLAIDEAGGLLRFGDRVESFKKITGAELEFLNRSSVIPGLVLGGAMGAVAGASINRLQTINLIVHLNDLTNPRFVIPYIHFSTPLPLSHPESKKHLEGAKTWEARINLMAERNR